MHGRRELILNYIRQAAILGFPLQFVVVIVAAVVMFVYLSGWAAMSQIEARHVVVSGSETKHLAQKNPNRFDYSAIEKRTWERTALFLCPLH